MREIEKIGSYKQKFLEGGPLLKRYWRSSSHLKACTAFTAVWNVGAWSSLFNLSERNVLSHGVEYNSILEALTVHPSVSVAFLFPVIGILMLYHTLAIWINSTEIKIEDGHFKLNRGPIPWFPSSVKVPVSDIKQAYVQEYSPYTENKTPVIRYRLMVQRYSGADSELETNIALLSDAQILERWLEQNIGLEDKLVMGEVAAEKKAA